MKERKKERKERKKRKSWKNSYFIYCVPRWKTLPKYAATNLDYGSISEPVCGLEGCKIKCLLRFLEKVTSWIL
jgi:hypothetical protein